MGHQRGQTLIRGPTTRKKKTVTPWQCTGTTRKPPVQAFFPAKDAWRSLKTVCVGGELYYFTARWWRSVWPQGFSLPKGSRHPSLWGGISKKMVKNQACGKEEGARAPLLSFPPPNFPRSFQTPATQPRRLQASGTDSPQSFPYRARREQRLPPSHHTLHVTKSFLLPITPCAIPGQSSAEITGE